jgi:predicted MFS family arabinose efflux permease
MLFEWAWITYWEWQHEGRKMKFTLWADDRALLSALALCALVFYVSARYVQRHAPVDQRIKARSLVIASVSAAIVVYVSVVTYISTIVSRSLPPR